MLIIESIHLCFFAGILQDEICLQNELYASLTDIVENGLLYQDLVFFFANLNKWPVKTGKSTRRTVKHIKAHSHWSNPN